MSWAECKCAVSMPSGKGPATGWVCRRDCLLACLLACLAIGGAGCDRLDMYDQPRYEPLERSEFFKDGLSARPLVAGTVARGELREDEAFYTGKVHEQLVSQIPAAALHAVYEREPARFPQAYDATEPESLRRALLERGQERFEIYCSVCHGATGFGDGMIPRRGFRKPPSYHTKELRTAPNGHFFDVITNGFGAMPSYASRIEVADRWAIVTYVRALQLSQSAELNDVPAEQRASLDQARHPSPADDDDTTANEAGARAAQLQEDAR